MKLPSIIALKDYVPHNHIPAFTRFNVFLRDDFTCQYCYDKKFSTKELTFDHLIPRSKGGLTNWENVVTACSHCNWTKGSKSLSQVRFKILKKTQRTLAILFAPKKQKFSFRLSPFKLERLLILG
jgi:5-methylcytosine-specific restriction endonuclease McrA